MKLGTLICIATVVVVASAIPVQQLSSDWAFKNKNANAQTPFIDRLLNHQQAEAQACYILRVTRYYDVLRGGVKIGELVTVTDYLVCNEQVTSQAGNPALVAAAQQQETKNVQERYVCKEQPNGELDCKPAPP